MGQLNLDTNARINPPLRTEADRQALIRGLNEGVIDAIATDHAPHSIQDKLCEFDMAAPGISCFETALGTLLLQVEAGELELQRILHALTIAPAAAFALGSRQRGSGALTPGASCDLVIFDADTLWTVDAARFASRGRNTPLNGVHLLGRIHAVLAGGELKHTLEAVHA